MKVGPLGCLSLLAAASDSARAWAQKLLRLWALSDRTETLARRLLWLSSRSLSELRNERS